MDKKGLLKYLSDFITPERFMTFNEVIEKRTSYLTVVLEDIFQSQNASAVLRTCDCFGIQNVNVIENRNEFDDDNQVSLGASKWLTVSKFNKSKNNSLEAINYLKKEGYRIVATTPHTHDINLEDFDLLKGKCALVFGSEQPGISETIIKEADEFLKIPMVGFTESFNISVSVAIILHHLTLKLRESDPAIWQLTEQEKEEIILQWLRNTIKRSELLEEEFKNSKK